MSKIMFSLPSFLAYWEVLLRAHRGWVTIGAHSRIFLVIIYFVCAEWGARTCRSIGRKREEEKPVDSREVMNLIFTFDNSSTSSFYHLSSRQSELMKNSNFLSSPTVCVRAISKFRNSHWRSGDQFLSSASTPFVFIKKKSIHTRHI